VLVYEDISEVIAHINANDKPLALYIFSSKSKNIENVVNKTSSGGICVNDVVLQFTNPNLPFGGVGTSGMGSAHGFYGFKAFSHERSIMRQSGLLDLNHGIYPPYTGLFKTIILKIYKKYI
jgi:aldehyde dehydrogenase (NAD+)